MIGDARIILCVLLEPSYSFQYNSVFDYETLCSCSVQKCKIIFLKLSTITGTRNIQICLIYIVNKITEIVLQLMCGILGKASPGAMGILIVVHFCSKI